MAFDKIVDSTALDTALTNIADSIRAKTGKTDPLTLEQMPSEIEGIQTSIGDDYCIINPHTSSISFQDASLPENFTIEFANPYNSILPSFFRSKGAVNLTIKGSMRYVKSWQNFLASASVKNVYGTPIDMSSATNTRLAFNCNLTHITFAPNTIKISVSFPGSSALDDESIQSILDGLADLSAEETAQTLTLHANVKARLTDEQIAAVTAKNWTIA